jgi:hypothetical protein
MGRIFGFKEDDSSDQEDQEISIEGVWESFWMVLVPTPNSEVDDICFESDRDDFTNRIRAGLKQEQIVGFYGDKQTAEPVAKKLLDTLRQARDDDAVIFHSPWSEWFATQEDCRSVWLCNKASAERIKVEPPAEWGNGWAWNISEQGTGIVMRRVQ